jgi:cytochrome c oxidase subunit 3
MLALPAAAPPAPRRQLLVGTALACAAAAMMFGGMLALYLRLRMRTVNTIDPATGEHLTWLPESVRVPEVAANNMLISFLAIFVFAQWAVWSARRNQRVFTVIAIALTALIGLAVINAQAYVYQQMGVGVSDGSFGSLFFAVTGTFVVLMIGASCSASSPCSGISADGPASGRSWLRTRSTGTSWARSSRPSGSWST